VALGEENLSRRLSSDIPKIAPAYFFIDIQPHQNDAFMQLVKSSPGITKVEKTPMTRGRVVAINGTPTKNVKPRQDIAWAVRGDRGLTYASKKPTNAKIIAGNWWPENYSGKPLISMGANVARGLNLDIGDTITFNILGREIKAKIANLRYIDWSNLQMNFVFIFSPGTLEAAPHSIVAAVYASGIGVAETVRNKVTDTLTNVSSISVKDAIKNAQDIISTVGFTIRTTSAFTLISGVLVLASALATQQQKRRYDATIYKVLGMSRMRILFLYLSEYFLLSCISAVLATLVSVIISWLILTKVMRSDFQIDFSVIVFTLGISLLIMILLGLVSTWRSLSLKPGRVLANS
jgi:putative ABC transport system permease protein